MSRVSYVWYEIEMNFLGCISFTNRIVSPSFLMFQFLNGRYPWYHREVNGVPGWGVLG